MLDLHSYSSWDELMQWILPFLPKLFSALLILGLGLPLLHYLKKKSLKKIAASTDPTLKKFLVNLIYILALIFLLITTLTVLGVATASLLTVLGAASLAVGFALKDFLSNIAAGFILIFLRPFKVGDYIKVQNTEGTVKEINLFTTILTTPANEALFIPNNQIASNQVINQTYYEVRRLDLSIGIDYSADIAKARQVLMATVKAYPFTKETPEPLVLVQTLGDNAVELIARVWVDSLQYSQSKFDLLEQFKINLEQNHIDIPFPQLTLHLPKTEVPHA